MKSLITFALGLVVGAAARHLLDPPRRKALRDQVVSRARTGAGQAAATATSAAAKAKGAVATARPSRTKIEDVDDVTLARKVETEIFRAADAPKGEVSIDVQAGVVYLRGTVADEAWITRLADDANKVDGVKGVKNLLHQPGTPAPEAEPRGAVSDRI